MPGSFDSSRSPSSVGNATTENPKKWPLNFMDLDESSDGEVPANVQEGQDKTVSAARSSDQSQTQERTSSMSQQSHDDRDDLPERKTFADRGTSPVHAGELPNTSRDEQSILSKYPESEWKSRLKAMRGQTGQSGQSTGRPTIGQLRPA